MFHVRDGEPASLVVPTCGGQRRRDTLSVRKLNAVFLQRAKTLGADIATHRRGLALELNQLVLNIGHPHPVGLAGRVAYVVTETGCLAADITFARQFSFTPFTKYFFCCIIYHELNPAS